MNKERKKLLISLAIGLGLMSLIYAQPAVRVWTGIRIEALRPSTGTDLRPLPLAAHWNLGEEKDGFSPAYQMKMLDQGHYLLPWFLMPNVFAQTDDPRWLTYYEAAIKRAAQLKLPISLVSTQWEHLLSSDDAYFKLPLDRNPNVVTSSGEVRKEVSPFGPVDPWREVGAKWGSSRMIKKLQEWYPNPPLILFVSNNEHTRLEWIKADEDRRFVARYGRNRDAEFKRKVVGDGWIERYRALQQGIVSGLASQAWKDKARFIGYESFGPPHFARWPGWLEHSLYSSQRISPWPLAWDGASPPFYVFNWSTITDYTLFSPQVEAMNWVFMLDETYRLNPSFWFEISTWDGNEPNAENDKRKFYQRSGQQYSPARYGGMVQFGMWLLRPRVVRDFRGYRETLDQAEPYFIPIVQAVDRVHQNSTLRDFWQKGRLVPNRARAHPYQTIVPPEYQKVDRWFLLNTSLDPQQPWEMGTVIPVYSLAIVKGNAPQRQWLIYAHSPMGLRKGVRIIVPDFGSIQMDVTVDGSFFTIDEQSRTVSKVN